MINRVVLTGRLTKDVDVRKTQSGLSVASFTIACNRNRKDASGNYEADFINCVAWRQSADFIGTYAHRGSMVGVDGRLQTRTYDDNQGVKHYVTEVICDSVQIFDSRTQSQNNGASYGQMNQGYNDSYGANDYNNNQNYNQGSYNNPSSTNNDASNDDDPGMNLSRDDLPF